MSIRTDLLKHKLLIQKYGIKEANTFVRDLRSINKLIDTTFKKDEITKQLNIFVANQFKRFVDFANYESKFNATIYSKYLKQDIIPIKVTRDMIIGWRFPLSRHAQPVSIKDSFERFINTKLAYLLQTQTDAYISGTDAKQAMREIVYGLFSAQAKLLVTSCINCIALNVRVLF